MNLGAVSICFVTMVIIATVLYEIFVLYCSINLFIGLSASLILETVFFLVIYYVDSFYIRLIFLSLINGVSGFVFPVNSILKAKILPEKYRALLMNIFRMPLNLYVIIVLLSLRFIDPMTVRLII